MKNNKIIIGIIAVVALLMISFFITPKKNNEKQNKENNTNITEDANTILANAQKESTNIKDSEKKDFINIDVNKYLEYFNGTEKKIVLIGRPTCHYCEIAEPILHNVAFEYNLDINYLNIDNFSEEDTANFYHSDESFSEGFGTPTLLIVSEGKIHDKVDGLTDKTHYIEFFKLNDFIK